MWARKIPGPPTGPTVWCRPGTFRVRVEDDDDAERGEHEFSTADELDVAINTHYSYRLRG